MFNMLAQAAEQQPVIVIDIPSQDEFIQSLMTLNPLQSMLLLAVGVVYLLQGWKIFKVLIIVNAAVLGIMMGHQFGGLLRGENMPVFGALAGGLLLGVLAWPLMKYAVSLMGALAGSLIGYGFWHYLFSAAGRPGLVEYSWAGALLGLVTMGLLAFIIFKFVVMMMTSFQGGMMFIAGGLSLLLSFESVSLDLQDALRNNVYLMPLLILVPTVIGLAFQHTAAAGKGKKPGGGAPK